jgi:hypothetical protein
MLRRAASSLAGSSMLPARRQLSAGVAVAAFRATDVRGGSVALTLSYPEYLRGDPVGTSCATPVPL